MAFAVKSCLDVVIWLTDRALNDREYLQPQKLHRLLFLAQAYYSVAYPGRKLMPATFVVDALGPVEPTVFHAFAYGRPPMLEGNTLNDQVVAFLDGIWRRFGNFSADSLTRKLAEHPAVAAAMAKGPNEEIPLDAMIKFYAGEAAARHGMPNAADVARPRVMRSQTGRPVAVKAWAPKALKPGKE
ncbi:type II toxin-antitoxin system antitoxin SocA domain-containing protein [Magnetospirillum sp. UT-4]|uniref:type II toxin-antitoxin system antitoxin SocA domain-containing protein n=1 Tax=Magnetospirillum sp. UT-4 TaxID=2681467 RepID=UPI00137EA4AD|nr:type II toxin-antitoxin system antitoxin SocA domain-containing protein [Magnetospirillum sp. UT-4]CAA7618154.1 Uncharacterized phage-associated protein [Magnetospirillum sp. UT-4]